MGFLGRLLGKEPPRIPAGGRPYVSMSADGSTWCVRIVMGDDAPTYRDWQVGPTFKHQTSAYAYLDWIEDPKGKPFAYPPGEA